LVGIIAATSSASVAAVSSLPAIFSYLSSVNNIKKSLHA
jgi:hypothetical protein